LLDCRDAPATHDLVTYPGVDASALKHPEVEFALNLVIREAARPKRVALGWTPGKEFNVTKLNAIQRHGGGREWVPLGKKPALDFFGATRHAENTYGLSSPSGSELVLTDRSVADFLSLVARPSPWAGWIDSLLNARNGVVVANQATERTYWFSQTAFTPKSSEAAAGLRAWLKAALGEDYRSTETDELRAALEWFGAAHSFALQTGRERRIMGCYLPQSADTCNDTDLLATYIACGQGQGWHLSGTAKKIALVEFGSVVFPYNDIANHVGYARNYSRVPTAAFSRLAHLAIHRMPVFAAIADANVRETDAEISRFTGTASSQFQIT
jgi:hypothetical protein